MAVSTTTLCKVTVARDEDFGAYLLTRCCKAAVTGTGDGQVVCKACYEAVPEVYGMSVSTTEGLTAALKELGCPCPMDCAVHTDWKLDLEQDSELDLFQV